MNKLKQMLSPDLCKIMDDALVIGEALKTTLQPSNAQCSSDHDMSKVIDMEILREKVKRWAEQQSNVRIQETHNLFESITANTSKTTQDGEPRSDSQYSMVFVADGEDSYVVKHLIDTDQIGLTKRISPYYIMDFEMSEKSLLI